MDLYTLESHHVTRAVPVDEVSLLATKTKQIFQFISDGPVCGHSLSRPSQYFHKLGTGSEAIFFTLVLTLNT